MRLKLVRLQNDLAVEFVGNLPLDAERPRLLVGRRDVVRLAINPAIGRKRRVFIDFVREDISTLNAEVWIRQTAYWTG